MSVPGQLVSGTFRGAALRQGTGVPGGRGRRVRRREALFQRNGLAHGECRADWLGGVRRYGARRTGLARPGGGTSGDADAAGYAAVDGVEGSALADFNTVQLRWRAAQFRSRACQRRGGLLQTVRRRDILNAYPYTNTLTVLEITGALRRAMERSVEYFTRNADGSLRCRTAS